MAYNVFLWFVEWISIFLSSFLSPYAFPYCNNMEMVNTEFWIWATGDMESETLFFNLHEYES